MGIKVIVACIIATVISVFVGCNNNQQDGYICDGVEPEGWTLQDSLNSLPQRPIILDKGWECPECHEVHNVGLYDSSVTLLLSNPPFWGYRCDCGYSIVILTNDAIYGSW